MENYSNPGTGLGGGGGLGNHSYCRNPNGRAAPWGFTAEDMSPSCVDSSPNCLTLSSHCGNATVQAACRLTCGVCLSWGFCHVCGDDSVGDCPRADATQQACACNPEITISGTDYRGRLGTTAGGHTCQDWASQSPNDHRFAPASIPGAGLEDGPYCRNPDGEPTAWYRTNLGDVTELGPLSFTSAMLPATFLRGRSSDDVGGLSLRLIACAD